MTTANLPPSIDTTKPSIARVYDAMLGGKDNFDVDRRALARMVELAPEIPVVARENRRWLARAVRWLAGDAGIDQFLDLGSGLPTAENTHELAQRENPLATVVYVDNDPAVVAHGRALLVDNERTSFAAADLTDPADVLAQPAVRNLDFTRPIAVLQCLTLHHIADLDEARRIMSGYIDHLGSGSYVAMTHAQHPEPGDAEGDRVMATARRYQGTSDGFTPRGKDEIRSLLSGLDIVEPGLVPLGQWRPDTVQPTTVSAMERLMLAVIARKP
ncbi:MAG: SAM-dependent methyltransferase [Sciscionella sp.]|nr:SAM-dependent methyltransferase [Sciscionella sp.]